MTLYAYYEDIDLEAAKRKYQGEPNGRLKERYLAIKLSYQGYKSEEVAQILSRNRVTIQIWIKTFNDQGWNGLQSADIPGRPSKMTVAQKQALKKK